MNPDTLNQLLLLEQSGELTPDQRKDLDAELAENQEARAQQATLRDLATAIPPVEIPPAGDAAARIAARLAQSPAPARHSLFLPVWKPALAAAAALALLLGVQSWRSPDAQTVETAQVQVSVEEDDLWSDPLEAEFAELDSLLAAIDSDQNTQFLEL
jgi:hypothetical protein